MNKAVVKQIEVRHSIENQTELHNIEFKNCTVGMLGKRPSTRLHIKNASLSDCSAMACHVGPVIFEDCNFKNLRSKSPLWICGAAFVRCKCTGFIDGCIAFELVDPAGELNDEINRGIYEDNQRIYGQIDYALDVSGADCLSLEVRGIPLELVKVNPDYHVKVSYKKAVEATSKLEPNDHMRKDIEDFLLAHSVTKSDFTIFTSPKKIGTKNRNYAQDQVLFQFLRDNDAVIV